MSGTNKPGSHAQDLESKSSSISAGPLFKNIAAGEEEPEITEIQSLCMNCEEQGTTRLLLTKVPFFRELIIMAFECPECGFRSNEIQSGGVIQPKGCKITLAVNGKKDVNREVVKSDSASIKIVELDFEIPASTQRGVLSTIEGLLSKSIDALNQYQPERYLQDPEVARKVAEVISKLETCRDGEMPFTFVLDDPAGNSFVENPFAPDADPAMTTEQYVRTAEQNEQLGLTEASEPFVPATGEITADEVMTIPSNCSHCNSPVDMHMKCINIPHFKEVIIMAVACDACGEKTNEIKTGGEIAPKGKKITLHITGPDDLNRDLLKGENASVSIPEIGLDSGAGTLGGRFTTIEGLLTQIKESLEESNPFGLGDSSVNNHSESSMGEKLKAFLATLEKVIAGEMDVHFVLDDPTGNSYLQNLYAPDPDPEMVIEEYTRTYEQDEELGLNQMNTENYMNATEEGKEEQEGNEDKGDKEDKKEEQKESL